MKFCAPFLNKTLPSKREFRENLLSGSHTLPNGINEFIIVLSTFLDRYLVKSGVGDLQIVPLSS